jgi:hypothetical protein
MFLEFFFVLDRIAPGGEIIMRLRFVFSVGVGMQGRAMIFPLGDGAQRMERHEILLNLSLYKPNLTKPNLT